MGIGGGGKGVLCVCVCVCGGGGGGLDQVLRNFHVVIHLFEQQGLLIEWIVQPNKLTSQSNTRHKHLSLSELHWSIHFFCQI